MKKDKIYPVDPPGYPDLDFKNGKNDELKEARGQRPSADLVYEKCKVLILTGLKNGTLVLTNKTRRTKK